MNLKLIGLVSVALLAAFQTGLVCGGEVVADSLDRRVALVELFTSEGCSSCPPAEKWLGALKDHPRLWLDFVPVAFHVDYWDYLGWRDPFASPDNTTRQRTYAMEWNESPYTPGFVVNGGEVRDGRPSLASGDKSPGRLRVERSDSPGEYVAVFEPQKDFDGGVVTLATLGFDQVSDVKRGENRGRKLQQDFVVREKVEVPLVKGASGWTAKFQLRNVATSGGGRQALACWVGDGRRPAPIQSAGGWVR